jgi:hypothetical protein
VSANPMIRPKQIAAQPDRQGPGCHSHVHRAESSSVTVGSNATGSGTAFCLRLLPESVEALRESGGTSLTELSGERVQAAMNEYAVTLPWNADFFGALERMAEVGALLLRPPRKARFDRGLDARKRMVRLVTTAVRPQPVQTAASNLTTLTAPCSALSCRLVRRRRWPRSRFPCGTAPRPWEIRWCRRMIRAGHQPRPCVA